MNLGIKKFPRFKIKEKCDGDGKTTFTPFVRRKFWFTYGHLNKWGHAHFDVSRHAERDYAWGEYEHALELIRRHKKHIASKYECTRCITDEDL